MTILHDAGLLTLDNEPDTNDQYEATLIESLVPQELPDDDDSEAQAYPEENVEFQPLEAQQVLVCYALQSHYM